MIDYDEKYMKIAIQESEKAFELGEVPVGCVIIRNGKIIAQTHNQKECQNDPTAHAEILAIREACNTINNWRLNDCIMYVTLEPCAMCTTAILYARIGRLVFGAFDSRMGACVSRLNLPEELSELGSVFVEGGILEKNCSLLLKSFFESRR